VQFFEDREYPTSNVFIEVFEGFIDKSFTKTAKFVHCNLGLRLGVSQKPMFFKASSNARRVTGLISIPTSSASIWDRQGRRSVFTTGGAPIAATVMSDFGGSFAEAAYKRDLLNRPFSPPRASNDELNKRQFR
jgi:hypothetical protein